MVKFVVVASIKILEEALIFCVRISTKILVDDANNPLLKVTPPLKTVLPAKVAFVRLRSLELPLIKIPSVMVFDWTLGIDENTGKYCAGAALVTMLLESLPSLPFRPSFPGVPGVPAMVIYFVI